jgi:hypothetical protein
VKGQSGIEYMIIIGFVTLAITLIIVSAYFYIGLAGDRIKQNQIEVLATKIISSSESVFFAGEPSQATITIYVPSGVVSIELIDYDLIIASQTSAGITKRAFTSRVKLNGNISAVQGSKKLTIKAQENGVNIS